MSKRLQDYIERIPSFLGLENNNPGTIRWYKEIITTFNKFIPEELKEMQVDKITPDMLLNMIMSIAQFGTHVSCPVLRGLRICFQLADDEGEILVNPMRHIHLRFSVKRSEKTIPDDLYGKMIPLFKTLPGGIMYGLCGFLDISLLSCARIRIQDCDIENNIILSSFIQGRTKRETRLTDKESIELFRMAVDNYDKNMRNPVYANNNKEQFLFTTKAGHPYTEKQCSLIGSFIRSKSENPEFCLSSYRKYIRMRGL